MFNELTSSGSGTSSSGTSMIPPSGVSGTLINQMSAFGTITAYATGLTNTQVLQLSGQSAWYPAFSAGLATAKQHAQEWLEVIGPDGFAAIPNAIVSFGTTFTNVASDISGILSGALSSSSGVLSSGQAKEIKELVGALVPTIDGILGDSKDSKPTTILGLSGLISGFITDVEHDYSALLKGGQGASALLNLDESKLATLSGDIANLQKSITKNQTDLDIAIGAGAAAFTALSIGAVIAGPSTLGLGALVMFFVGFVAEAGAVTAIAVFENGLEAAENQLKADQSGLTAEEIQITSLQAIISSIDTLSSENLNAQAALNDVADMFSVLKGKVADVLQELSGVDASGLPPIIQELDLQTAQDAWNQLVTYAQKIQDSTITPSAAVPGNSGALLG